ncbi:hypothetical protein OGATHE_002548 [Ogataea polymorpha]|uniref:RNA polymerase II assembly factor Rtp1 C-terminal domain-containing protein n=2 Tax=Ogataea polymorpha TaxID=460523 RepID=A0A9P8T8C3_9ASCO|nr:hypothetical protein KL908_000147 [Ogataea polymorpha]KAG7920292.1 hypothetical protein KL927_000972 [Ogataea polymorpha]KAG7938399.1 hypothetical protein KL934_000973 [Ogataea polymorpha]KAH3669736.1 hypothetical protein OGATHE_002548 [Ogataea polymorpha]
MASSNQGSEGECLGQKNVQSSSNLMDLEKIKQDLKGFRPDPTYVRKRTTPLGKLFDKVSDFVGTHESPNTIDEMYAKMNVEESTDDKLKRRELVIHQLLQFLLQIHSLVPRNNQTDIIAIPLYDMKIVSKVVNIIVIEGVYTCLPPGIGFPLVKRRLKNFKIPLKVVKVPYPQGKPILQDIVDTFTEIYKTDSDLKNLLLVGTGYTDALTCCIVLAKTEPSYQSKFKFLESISSTYQLFSLYGTLVSQPLQPWFKNFVMDRLADLVVERAHNGVQSLIEVIMGLRENETIDVAKIDEVLRVLLSTKPSRLTKIEYLQNIGNQLYNILVHVNWPVMVSIVTQLLEQLYVKNPLIVRDFVFKRIWNILNPDTREFSNDDENIMLTSEVELNNAFNVVLSITRTSGNEDFVRTMFEPIAVPFWSYLLYQRKTSKDYSLIERVLVSVLARPDENYTILNILLNNLMAIDGSSWEFGSGENGLTYIKEKFATKSQFEILDSVDFVATSFGELLKKLSAIDEYQVQYVFLACLKAWLNADERLLTKDDENPFFGLINLKMIEYLGDNFKDSLTKSVDGTLELLYSVIKDEKKTHSETLNVVNEKEDSDDEENDDNANLKIVFEILSTIISDSKLSSKSLKTLSNIQLALQTVNSDLGQRLSTIMSQIDTKEAETVTKEEQDIVIRQKALKNLADNSPPIRVHGLQLLRKLVVSQSPAISLAFAINQHMLQLKDPEPFVYLNAIRGLEELLRFDQNLIDNYLNIYSNPKINIDERLKVGEVILRYINFSGNASKNTGHIIGTTLAIVRKDSNNEVTMKTSAMSLLGSLCRNNPLAILNHMEDIMDCVFGILQLETKTDFAVLRRSAIVLVSDILSTSDGLQLLGKYGDKLDTTLKYIAETDNDYLAREQALSVLSLVDDKFAQTFRETVKIH